MQPTDFTEHPSVCQIINDLNNAQISKRVFSDVIDKEGHQYVDYVQEGGGVLGVALLGYTYVLESMGIRFHSLAGTSAGAINTMLLASVGKMNEAKSARLLDLLANKDLYDFVDGKTKARRLIEEAMEQTNATSKTGILGSMWDWGQIGFYLFKARKLIFNNLGLNPGKHFLAWMAAILKDEGIHTTEELLRKRKECIQLFRRNNAEDAINDALQTQVAVIVADITTESKIEFPRMGKLYWQDPEKVNPSVYVRASMSIPFFFEPLRIENIPQTQNNNFNDFVKTNWRTLTGYEGKIPSKVLMVDGGILSNFPIDVFHQADRVPRLPTFGVKLGSQRDVPKKIDGATTLAGAVFDSARHLYDYDFILKNPDYKQLVEYVEIGDHNWLDFAISDAAKLDLFVRGAEAAKRFLMSFDWKEYKGLRRAKMEGERSIQTYMDDVLVANPKSRMAKF